ncbi:hypothetical protein [Actinoplanes regularis]|uniref:hypothetical protein n=1 Tax=Actinoplanes regularis TaxID=52697 RepID=UPI0015C68BE7|nr:hypothetical protein [Actinoplanes regularis]
MSAVVRLEPSNDYTVFHKWSPGVMKKSSVTVLDGRTLSGNSVSNQANRRIA